MHQVGPQEDALEAQLTDTTLRFLGGIVDIEGREHAGTEEPLAVCSSGDRYYNALESACAFQVPLAFVSYL